MNQVELKVGTETIVLTAGSPSNYYHGLFVCGGKYCYKITLVEEDEGSWYVDDDCEPKQWYCSIDDTLDMPGSTPQIAFDNAIKGVIEQYGMSIARTDGELARLKGTRSIFAANFNRTVESENL